MRASASGSSVDGAAEAALVGDRALAAARGPRRPASGVSSTTRERLMSGRVDLEERVLRRRADEHDDAILDGRQQRVLLRLARTGGSRR